MGEAGPLGGQGAVEDTFLNHRGNLNLDSRSSRVSHLQWITLCAANVAKQVKHL